MLLLASTACSRGTAAPTANTAGPVAAASRGPDAVAVDKTTPQTSYPSTPTAIQLLEPTPPAAAAPADAPAPPASGGAVLPPTSASVVPADRSSQQQNRITWQWPTTSRVISDPFGIWRREGYHTGIDIIDRWQAPVYAAGPGVVVWADDEGPVYGLSIVIRHPNGWLTRYAHLSGIFPWPNEWVEAGQLIGQMGDSGYAFGTHLHFEVIADGRYLDPLAVLLGTY